MKCYNGVLGHAGCMFRLMFLVLTAIPVISCNVRLEPVQVRVEDPVRHYYPMIAGEKLNISYEIRNEGDSPLVISEVHPSCGCISSVPSRLVVPPGKKSSLGFVYDSSKNLGYVHNVIRLYGNFSSGPVLELEFDVNVVPPADYVPDYEELSRNSRADRRLPWKNRSTPDDGLREYYVE